MPLVYAHELFSEYNLYFLNGSHFSSFLYVALLSNMVKLRTFISGTVMHLYWGYPQERNYSSIDNILKVMNF